MLAPEFFVRPYRQCPSIQIVRPNRRPQRPETQTAPRRGGKIHVPGTQTQVRPYQRQCPATQMYCGPGGTTTASTMGGGGGAPTSPTTVALDGGGGGGAAAAGAATGGGTTATGPPRLVVGVLIMKSITFWLTPASFKSMISAVVK